MVPEFDIVRSAVDAAAVSGSGAQALMKALVGNLVALAVLYGVPREEVRDAVDSCWDFIEQKENQDV